MNVERIADVPSNTGEGPLWHPVEKVAYWTDIPAGRLYRYDPATGANECVLQGRPIGGFTLQADGSLLLFRDKGGVDIWRDGKIVKTVIESMPGHEATRFNDVCATHAGNVYCGTMHGHYYNLATDGTITLVRDGYLCPNGMGFSPDNKWMYYNDAGRGKTYRWAYDMKSGAISNDTVLHDAKADTAYPGAPDGMCVDAEGFIWIARWGGYGILRHSPVDGKIVAKIDIPTRCVSSVCFGGDNLDTMYVTTAGGQDRNADDSKAGSFFRVTGSGFTGLVRPVSRVGIGFV